jgi:hypothetical protein
MGQSRLQHLEILCLIPDVVKGRVAGGLATIVVSLAALERRVDVDQLHLAFKSVVGQVPKACQVVAVKEHA